MTQLKTTTDALRALMQAHGLTRGDVARILGLKPRPHGGSHGTVDGWLCGASLVPRAKLELIFLKAATYKRPSTSTAGRDAIASDTHNDANEVTP